MTKQMTLTKEEILAKVRSSTWNIQVFNGMPLYLSSAAIRSGWKVGNEFGVSYTHFFFLFADGRAHMYYDKEDWDTICDAYYRTVSSIEQLNDKIIKHRQDYEDLIRRTAKNTGELIAMNDAQLVKYAIDLCDRLTEGVGFTHAIEGITFGSEKRLRAILKKQGSSLSEKTFGILCAPVLPSFLLEAQLKLWQLRDFKGSEQQVAVSEFIKEFGWIENTYLGKKVFSEQDVIDRAGQIKNEPSLMSVEHIREQKEVILETYKITAENRFVVETIEMSFSWQDDRKKYILQTIDILDPVIEIVAQRFALDKIDLKFAIPEELSIENLSDKNFKDNLRNRRRNCALYVTPGEYIFLTGSNYRYLARELDEVFDDNIQELKGVAASPGVVQGVVKVCESVSDIEKVQSGEIIVASMTRPEYLPAMQKAAAFVTNEGGITSHAAIVARELGKPCVIGTKIATQILKDGDLVEVDADEGVVRLLE